MASFDGATLLTAQLNFHTNHLSVPAPMLTGWNRRILRSFELFNLLAPSLKLLKCATARTSHAKVIVKYTRVLKFDFFLLRGSVKF